MMQFVRGGGFELMTDDPVVIAVVRRCADLELQLREMRWQEVARFRSLRRDVRQIKTVVTRRLTGPSDPGEVNGDWSWR